MGLSDQLHTVRFPLADLIVRDLDHTLRAPVELDGATVTPSAATVSVYDASSTAIVSAAAAAVVAGVMTYTIPAATLPTSLAVAEGWRVEWSLTVDGSIIRARNDAALVRRLLYPVIGQADIIRRLRRLDKNARGALTVQDSQQDAIDESFLEIQGRLIEKGNRPNLITSPSSLRRSHLDLAISYALESMGPAFHELSKDWRDRFEESWDRMTFMYDTSDGGTADSTTARKSGNTTVWLSS